MKDILHGAKEGQGDCTEGIASVGIQRHKTAWRVRGTARCSKYAVEAKEMGVDREMGTDYKEL